MLCQKCGVYVSDDEILCPNCGALLDRHEQDSGVRAIRQGKKGAAPMPSAAEETHAPSPERREPSQCGESLRRLPRVSTWTQG